MVSFPQRVDGGVIVDLKCCRVTRESVFSDYAPSGISDIAGANPTYGIQIRLEFNIGMGGDILIFITIANGFSANEVEMGFPAVLLCGRGVPFVHPNRTVL